MSTTTLSELRVMLEAALEEIRAGQPDLARNSLSKALGKIDAAEFVESMNAIAPYMGKK